MKIGRKDSLNEPDRCLSVCFGQQGSRGYRESFFSSGKAEMGRRRGDWKGAKKRPTCSRSFVARGGIEPPFQE